MPRKKEKAKKIPITTEKIVKERKRKSKIVEHKIKKNFKWNQSDKK